MPLTLYAFTCGWFQVPLSFFLKGAGDALVRSPIPAYLIDHPKGRALFDTGLGQRFVRPADKRLKSDARGFDFVEGDSIAARLRDICVDPSTIRWIINSHFHADHCGGNASIPNATVVIQRREREAGWAEASAGSRLYAISEMDVGHPVAAIDGEHDLFGDGSVIVFPTFGHTPGHQSALVRLESGDVVLAADCCYLQRSLDEFRLSSNNSDPDQALHSLRHLARMRASAPR